jgi:hypothetical protein
LLIQIEIEMMFDESFGMKNIWVTEDYFYRLSNNSRTDFVATVAYHCDLEESLFDLEGLLAFSPAQRKQVRDTMYERKLCHHCQKLVVDSEIVVCGKQCRNSQAKKVCLD